MAKAPLDTTTVLDALKNGSFNTWDRETQIEALKIREDNKNIHSTHILNLVVDENFVSKLPHDILDNKSMSAIGEFGEVSESLLHMCATNKQWRDLPKHLFTEENFLVQDFWGNTPIQEAASCGFYDIILENLDILSEKTFIDVNKDSISTLELIISTNIGRFQDRAPLENKKEVLPKILAKFNPKTLKRYYDQWIKDNNDIDSKDKDIFRKALAMPMIKKLAQSEKALDI
jgi:hypothetical protein